MSLIPVEEWPIGDAIRGQQKKTTPSEEVEHGGQGGEDTSGVPGRQLKHKATGKDPMPPPPEKKSKPTGTRAGGKLKINEEVETRRRAIIESSNSDTEDTVPLSQKFRAKRSEGQPHRPTSPTDAPRRQPQTTPPRSSLATTEGGGGNSPPRRSEATQISAPEQSSSGQ